MKSKKGLAGIAAILLVVSGIIGLVIVDTITGDTVTPGSITNETVGTANASGYLSETLDNYPVVAVSSVYCNDTTTTNYTVTTATGAIVVDGADCTSDVVKASYTYEDDNYFTNSISRTIVAYIVPIALLGIFGYIALMGR